MKPPSDERKRGLTQALKRYNEQIDTTYHDWPSDLLCSLEHTYSKEDFSQTNFSRVGLTRVDTLKFVCGSLGFEVYLSFKARIEDASDDSSGDSTDSDHGNTVEYLYDLQGRLQMTRKSYDDIDLFDTYDSDDQAFTDDEAAMEDGATSDDGCHASWDHDDMSCLRRASTRPWTSSAILIVPPSRKIDFQVDIAKKTFRTISKLLAEYTARHDTASSYEAHHFKRLCKIGIERSRAPNLRSLSRGSRPEKSTEHDDERRAIEAITQIVIDMGWTELYDMLSSKWTIKDDSFRIFASFLAERGYDSKKWVSLRSLLQTESTLQVLLHAGKVVQRGQMTHVAASTAEDWVDIMGQHFIETALESAEILDKNAGANLALILSEHAIELLQSIMLAIGKFTTTGAAAFILNTATTDSNSQNDVHGRLLERMTRRVWNSHFAFEGPERMTQKLRHRGRQHQGAIIRDSITPKELVQLLEITQPYVAESGIDVLPLFHQAILKVSSNYAKEHMSRLVAELMKRTVMSLLRQATDISEERVIDLVKTALTTLITSYIGSEPKRPTNFAVSRIPCSCNCTDCTGINNYLTSQEKPEYTLRVSDTRMLHIQSNFANESDGMYEISTDKKRTPYTWQIAKTFSKTFANVYGRWLSRVKWMQEQMRILMRREGSLLTEELLGKDLLNAFTLSKVESLQSVAEGRLLMASGGMARKRKVDDGVQAGQHKKLRVMS